MSRATIAVVSGILTLTACRPAHHSAPTPPAHTTATHAASPSISVPPPPPAPPAIEVRTIAVPDDQPVFYLASRHPSRERIVFLHGACVHGLGYLQSFQSAAAQRASAIALQGDAHCHGIFRAWSGSISQIDARIAAAFRAAGDNGPLEDMIVIGYSQGALMAQHLASAYPHRYSRVVLIGEPGGPDALRLRRARAVVAISGTLDNPSVMRRGAEAVAARGVPATFIAIPNATHGQMGDGNRIIGDALDWIEAHQRAG